MTRNEKVLLLVIALGAVAGVSAIIYSIGPGPQVEIVQSQTVCWAQNSTGIQYLSYAGFCNIAVKTAPGAANLTITKVILNGAVEGGWEPPINTTSWTYCFIRFHAFQGFSLSPNHTFDWGTTVMADKAGQVVSIVVVFNTGYNTTINVIVSPPPPHLTYWCG